jgi:hypothetical protein
MAAVATTTGKSTGKSQKPIVTVRGVVISIILVVAVVLFVWAVNSGRDNLETTPHFANSAVEATYPKEGDLDLRQSRIGIDLVSGYEAELSIDNQPIPKDEVQFVVGLDQYFYQPGPGTATGALSPGRHCAKATITKVIDPNTPESTFSWCFQIH